VALWAARPISVLANFLELRKGEVRRIPLPRTPVNKAQERRGSILWSGREFRLCHLSPAADFAGLALLCSLPKDCVLPVAYHESFMHQTVWLSMRRNGGDEMGLLRGKAAPRVPEVCSPVLLLLAVLVVVVGWGGSGSGSGGGSPAGGAKQGGTLTILAASSLTDAFAELGKIFEQQNPGTTVKMSLGASSDLLAQIQQGAPADVFASAAQEEMNTAVKDGLVAGKPEVFVKNREIIMVPKDNPANIKALEDLSKPNIKLVLAAKDVPAADYAVEILAKANKVYGPDFKQDVLSNVVSREADVRASVNRVVVGDADATFGYASDYTPDIRDKVKVITIPPNLNIIATYPIAALKEAKEPSLARKWVDLVTSKEGQKILKKWKFEPAAD
jgi:molybdate transport system substrate-binding protein